MIPGVSLHRERQRLVAAGFTPLEALQSATINPARILDKLNDFGTIEKGKIADLVLFGANPLEDIRNAERVAAAMAGGRYISRDELDRMLRQIEIKARSM